MSPSGQVPLLDISSAKGGRGAVIASITNIGNVTVQDVPWSISIHGGMFGFINISSQGTIGPLGVGNVTSIQSAPSLIGLGRISIMIQLKYAEAWNGTGLVFGPFVFRVLRYC
jgi:hypothetical protein